MNGGLTTLPEGELCRWGLPVYATFDQPFHAGVFSLVGRLSDAIRPLLAVVLFVSGQLFSMVPVTGLILNQFNKC
jgi:ABC-type microcin C transport system permease subunit YejB